ncbi:hypothetical protein BC828DRAFT_399703 [Blastocladiella britannica]|nr:hypothetical protein BC828DRAFT_399703 [Blastocladiella britannica]
MSQSTTGARGLSGGGGSQSAGVSAATLPNPGSLGGGPSTANPAASSTTQRSPLDDLASLRRLLMAEEDSRPTVTGVLALRIKEAHFLDLHGAGGAMEASSGGIASSVGGVGSAVTGCFATTTVRGVAKKTHVVTLTQGVLRWDQAQHFSVSVPRSRKHPFNLIKLQILAVTPSDPARTTLVGSVSFHLHDIISVSPIASVFDLWDEHRLVGDIELEMTFNYGSFGYGYSPQLKEDKRSPNELVAYSLFPRINPPQQSVEAGDGVMAVKAVPHPSYLPFTQKVYLSYGRELGDLASLTERQYAPDLVAQNLSHLTAIRDQYAGMNDRVARLLFLQNYLNVTNQKPEVMYHPPPPAPPPTVVPPAYVQPFNIVPAVKDDVVFRALARRRELATGAAPAATAAAPQQSPVARTRGSVGSMKGIAALLSGSQQQQQQQPAAPPVAVGGGPGAPRKSVFFQAEAKRDPKRKVPWTEVGSGGTAAITRDPEQMAEEDNDGDSQSQA